MSLIAPHAVWWALLMERLRQVASTFGASHAGVLDVEVGGDAGVVSLRFAIAPGRVDDLSTSPAGGLPRARIRTTDAALRALLTSANPASLAGALRVSGDADWLRSLLNTAAAPSTAASPLNLRLRSSR